MGAFQNWKDSFKPAEKGYGHDTTYGGDFPEHMGDKPEVLGDMEYTNTAKAVEMGDGHVEFMPQESALKRRLQSRHVQFIALGGSIGTGLFIGSGQKLATAGPASLLIDFIIVGIMLMCVVFALGELATILPVSGAFSAYSTRFVDPAWGFAMGWSYWLQWIVVMPLEFTAATIVLKFWDDYPHPALNCPKGVWIVIFLAIIVFINLFGVRGYGEAEFVISLIKIITVIGFIIACIVISVGGGLNNHYYGAHYWHDPGAFNNAFKGFCSVFPNAAFAFAGTELVGLAAAETAEPRKMIPKACKQVIVRLMLLYLVPLFLITLLLRYNDKSLVGSSSYDPNASPFVLVFKETGVRAVPHIVNVVIVLSTLSVANSSVFGSSRTLLALAEQGLAPKFFRYVDREGRPLPAVVVSLLFGCLAFLIYAKNEGTIFDWLVDISSLALIFTWGSTCLAHIRFRMAWKRRGRTLRQIPWTSPLGVTGSMVGFALNVLVVVANFYISAFPIDEGSKNSNDRADSFFEGMISLVIALVLFIGWKIYKRTRVVKLDEMDLDTGRREEVSDELLEQERFEFRARPWHQRVFYSIF